MAKIIGTMTEWAQSRSNTKGVDLDEIDPKKEVLISKGGPSVKQVECESLTEWVLRGRVSTLQGHTLHPSDSPLVLKLGFVDATTNEEYLLPVRLLKEASDAEYRELGVTRTQMRTEEGRAQVIGTDRFFQSGEAIHEPDPELQAEWGHFRPYGED